MRLRIDLSYDGSAYSGWAKQPGRPSVQADLETALARALRVGEDEVRTVVAGRTDSGVHALGQVCHVDVPIDAFRALPGTDAAASLTKRLRGALRHSQVWVKQVSVAPEGFDARFSPLSRHYEYRIADAQSSKDPRLARHTVWLDDSLDAVAMNALGEALRGLHDFASFCRARAGATTIRTLQEFSWNRDESGVLVAQVSADAFCHSMVRSLVGAAVSVGRGRLDVPTVVALRDAAERTSAWKTMPAHGLTLIEVVYPETDQLAARADATRQPRAPLSD